MTSRIINQRSGFGVAEFTTYEMAAEHRLELRRQLDPTLPCPYAIRTDLEVRCEMAKQEELFPAPTSAGRSLVPVDGWPDPVIADPAAAAERVAEHLTAFTYRWATERDLQDAIAGLLADSTFAVEREKRLDRRDRPDFLVVVDGRTVAVEVKVKASRNAVLRQLGRYAEHDVVDAIVFAAGRRTLAAGVPTVIHGKPVISIHLESAL